MLLGIDEALFFFSNKQTVLLIAYASGGLRANECNYPAHKLAFFALKWAVTDKFHDYLYGNKISIHLLMF